MSATSSTVFGGSSAGDTAAGNDTLQLATMGAGRIDMGGGANRMIVTGSITAGTIVSGAGNDTFSTSANYAGARLGTGAGNDSLNFSSTVTAGSTYINSGAGNDTMTFSTLTSATSIMGGTGNDSLNFTMGATNYGFVNSDTEYFYEGGTDTLFFSGTLTNTGAILNVNVDSSDYSSVAATSVASGTTIVGSNTSGGVTTSTTLAYVLGASNSANITAGTVATSVFTSVTALG